MNNFWDFWNDLKTNVENFFDLNKGKLPFKIIKYYLFLLLSFASTAFFMETFSLVVDSHELRIVALYFMWFLLTIIIIVPGAILLLIDKILNLNLLSNYSESFLEQCQNLSSEWNGIVICFITIIVSLLLFRTINIAVESDRE